MLIRAGGSKGNPMPAEKRLILVTPLSTGLSHTKQNRHQRGKWKSFDFFLPCCLLVMIVPHVFPGTAFSHTLKRKASKHPRLKGIVVPHPIAVTCLPLGNSRFPLGKLRDLYLLHSLP